MGLILYLFVAFIVFFFCVKKLYPIAKEKANQTSYGEPFEFVEYWLCVILPLFWIVAVPFYFFWKLLEKIFKY